MNDISIDLETMGVVADACIISIGAVRFDRFSNKIDDNAFYANISLDSNLAAGRRLQESTLQWWFKQSADAQAMMHEPKISLDQALIHFDEWLGDMRGVKVWGNGADFDNAMLNHAFVSHDMKVPWEPWSAMCLRTLKNLPGAKIVADGVKFEGVKHNALTDAVHQAKLVQALFAKMFTDNHPFKKKGK